MTIPGYGYGAVIQSTVTREELRQLESTVGWTDEDGECLRGAAEVLVPQAAQMVDEWRAAIGRQPHLLASFMKPEGHPDDAYRAAVKGRFVQWVSDLCLRPHDRDWLNYQEQIGLRHTPAGKNRTDGADTPPVVPLRYLIAFSIVVTGSLRPYLAGKTEEELQRIQTAWNRAVMLSIALWARPYASPGLW
jgi:hypothetical protein